jgi:hypothetical protein
MFISINSNDLNLLHFLEENIPILTTSILLKETNARLLELDFTSSKRDIKISSPNQEILTIAKPLHFTQILNKINIFQQNYSINIGSIYYFPFLGTLTFNDQKSLLSETQNHILCRLVCFKEGIEKNILYKAIWPRDKNISENKLDTHLTNLRSHILEFSNQRLNFKTVKGSIKLDIS